MLPSFHMHNTSSQASPQTVNNVSQVVHGAHCPNNNLNLRITTESVTAVLQMRKGMCLISVPDSCVQNQANIVKT